MKNTFFKNKEKETDSDSCLEIGVATFDFVLARGSGSGSSNLVCLQRSPYWSPEVTACSDGWRFFTVATDLIMFCEGIWHCSGG